MAWSCRDSLLREEFHRKTSHIYVKPEHTLHGLILKNRNDFLIELFHEEVADRIYDMKLREDDIWILSYPKCGTTWAIETVWLVMNDVRKEFSAISPPDPPKYVALTSHISTVE